MKKNLNLEHIQLTPGKKIYFASDFHLGAPNFEKSLIREKTVCKWLDSIKKDAQVVFLVGDMFDFWFEHRLVRPKGFSRFFGKLAELKDLGIRLEIFSGNHDMWMRDMFKQEFGSEVSRNNKLYLINNRSFIVGHGDGLGPGDYGYKLLKRVFENNILRWMFANLVHPDIALKLGNLWASHSWKKHDKENDVYVFHSKEKEILYNYCLEQELKQHHDYYIFGHRHYKLDIPLSAVSRYINLGDWIRFNSYAVFDGKELYLLEFRD